MGYFLAFPYRDYFFRLLALPPIYSTNLGYEEFEMPLLCMTQRGRENCVSVSRLVRPSVTLLIIDKHLGTTSEAASLKYLHISRITTVFASFLPSSLSRLRTLLSNAKKQNITLAAATNSSVRNAQPLARTHSLTLATNLRMNSPASAPFLRTGVQTGWRLRSATDISWHWV